MSSSSSASLVVGVLGDPGVGKRNLALSFKTKQPTSANAVLDFSQLEADDMTLVMINSTDAAGKFAIQRADILLVVFALDSPHSFLSCERKWGPELKGEKKPIILVGTKSDKKLLTRATSTVARSPQSSIDGQRLQKDLKAISFVSCSAHTKEGIESLFNETMAAGLKVKKQPKQVSGKGGVFGGLFRKTNALYPDAAKEGVEINNDTDAAELRNVCFPLKLIKEKWLFHTDEYLKPQKDRGPSSALHGALCCLKNLYYMEGKAWTMKRDTIPIQVGLIKATSDCGNSSVSMGLAWIYFKKATKDDKALALINCGTGGVRFQLYVKTAGTVSCLLEFKPPGGGKGVFTNLRCGSYVPKQEQSAATIAEEIKQGLASAPWNNPKLREKMAKQFGLKSAEQLKVPVVAYITGTIRNHWESKLNDAKETEAVEKAINGVLDSVLPGKESYFTSILGEEKGGYLIKQRLEGQMELTGLRGLYSQYSTATGAALVAPGMSPTTKDPLAGRNLEPVISLGIGKGSSQWTTVDAANADDYTKYTLEPEIKYGMDADDLGERLASAIVNEYKSKGTDSLAHLMESVFKRGHIPVIALKSGCLLSLDDASKSKEGGPTGRERRKALVELGAVPSNMFPVTVIFARKSGERTQEMLGTSSVAVACAQACKTLMLPGENPIPQFLKVQVEGQEGYLTSEQLKDVKPKTVLIFLTAADLTGKTVAGPPKHMPRATAIPEAKPKRSEKIIVESFLKRKDANGKGWTEKYFVLTKTDLGWMDSIQERLDKPAPASFVTTRSILSCSPVREDETKCQFELKVSYGEGEDTSIFLDAPDSRICQKWQRRVSRLLLKLAGKSSAADRSTDDEAPVVMEEKKAPPPPPPRVAPARAPPRREEPVKAVSVVAVKDQASAINAMMGDLGLEEEEEEPQEDPDDPADDDLPQPGEDSEEDVPAPVPTNNSTKKGSSPELTKVLTSLGLAEYIAVLSADEYLLSDLPHLPEAELAQLIPSSAARTKLLAHLRERGLAAKSERVQPIVVSDEVKATVGRLQKKYVLHLAGLQAQEATLSSLSARL